MHITKIIGIILLYLFSICGNNTQIYIILNRANTMTDTIRFQIYNVYC